MIGWLPVAGAILPLVTILLSGRAYAQACCGRLELPTAGTERGGNRDGQLLVGLTYDYRLLSGGLLVDGYGFERANEHTWTLDASFGVNSWLTSSIIAPYGTRSYDTRVAGASVSRRTHGFGDAVALIKVMLIGRRALAPGASRLWIGGGLKLPTGQWEGSDEIGRLPASSQMGSGTYDPLVAAYYTRGLTGPDSPFIMFASGLYRHTGTNAQGYRFGSDLATSLDGFYTGIDKLSIRMGARWRTAAVDRQDALALGHSGGWQLFGRLGAAWYVRGDTSINVDIYLPVVDGLRGDQLDPRLLLATALIFAPSF